MHDQYSRPSRRRFLTASLTASSLWFLRPGRAWTKQKSQVGDGQPVEQPFSSFQHQIYRQGLEGKTPRIPISPEELEAAAKRILPAESYDYAAGGAGSEKTMKANLAGFDRWAIVPRVLRDVSSRNYRVKLFDSWLPAPIALAPIGQLGAIHADAEVASGRAAASLGLPLILSTVSSKTIEQVAEVMGEATRWFQLYWPNDPALTKSFLQRAERAGYSAVFVTLDTRLLGWRDRDLSRAYLPFFQGIGLANYFSDPVFQARLKSPPQEDLSAAVQEFGKVWTHLEWTWKDIAKLRKYTSLPIILKGILHPDDAQEALKAGADGIVVSNHGGRQVDGAIGAIDALPGVVDVVGREIPVLFDSGVRRGSDIVKALALGASAVLIGRPHIWGLAIDGEAGVTAVLQCLLAEFDLTMALSGFNDLSHLNPSVLRECRQ